MPWRVAFVTGFTMAMVWGVMMICLGGVTVLWPVRAYRSAMRWPYEVIRYLSPSSDRWDASYYERLYSGDRFAT
jgi:hypothetical protein